MTQAVEQDWILGQILSGVFARAADQAEQQQAALARQSCARALSEAVAVAAGKSSGEALALLDSLPNGAAVLLETPEGWEALADYLAADLGAASIHYKPTVH